mgnify:CR=1 FL=1
MADPVTFKIIPKWQDKRGIKRLYLYQIILFIPQPLVLGIAEHPLKYALGFPKIIRFLILKD